MQNSQILCEMDFSVYTTWLMMSSNLSNFSSV